MSLDLDVAEIMNLTVDEANKLLKEHYLKNGDPIFQNWPLETRVEGTKGWTKGRKGTVKSKPEDQLYEFLPCFVPVLWDCNDSEIFPVRESDLIRI